MSLLIVKVGRWFVIVGCTLTLGCRGSMPFGRTVQITKSSDAAEITIESPEQRLATSKSSKARDIETDVENEAAVDPVSESPLVDVQQSSDVAVASISEAMMTSAESSNSSLVVSSASSDAGESAGEQIALVSDESLSKQEDAEMSVADAYNEEHSDKRSDNGSIPIAEQNTNVPHDLTVPGLSKDMSANELLSALNSFPPAKREEAVKEFVQLVVNQASASNQPNQVAGELAKALTSELVLPEASDESNSERPERLASGSAEDVTSSKQEEMVSYTLTDHPEENQDMAPTVSEAEEATLKEGEKTTGDEASMAESVAVHEHDLDSQVEEGVAQTSLELPNTTADPPQAGIQMPTIEDVSQEQLLKALIASLQENPDDESEQDRYGRLVKLSHLMVLAGDPEAGIKSMDARTPAEQDFVRHQLQGLWQLIDPDGHPSTNRRFTAVASEFREAAKHAGAATDSLDIRRLAFCTEIEAYGRVTPFPKSEFNAGQQVILYSEVDNFLASEGGAGYELNLQGSYEIIDAGNEKVFDQLLPADRQVSANHLRDYFVAYQMFLPADLRPGTYRLRLTMEDLVGKKYGQGEISFEIK